MWLTSSRETVLTPTAVALGNFDGVHRGHKRVVQPVLNVARNAQQITVSALGEGQCLQISNDLEPEDIGHAQLSSLSPKLAPIYATVVSFNPHPQEFFSGQPRQLLTPPDEKVKYLRSLGIDQVVLLPFDRELAALSPEEFVEKILVQYLNARCISVGQDFCFGKKRAGTAATLQAIATKYDINVNIVPLKTCGEQRISSSSIREALQQGDLKTANRLLGRSYTLTGKVVTGQQLGRTIGFPTANLQLPGEKFLPKYGVYIVKAFIHAEENTHKFPTDALPGIMNIGSRPTVDGTNLAVEVHLFDWSGDLYGKTLTVSLEQFVRPEQKFTDLEALKSQIVADCTVARHFFQDLK